MKAQFQNRRFRQVHRWIGITAALLFLSVGATGVVLQIQEMFGSDEQQKEQLASSTSPVRLAAKLRVDQQGLERARLTVLQALGDRPLDAIDWQIKGPRHVFTFHLGGEHPLKAEVQVPSGRIDKIEPDGESSLLKLHTGEIIGDGGKVLGLVWGAALLAMVLTGLFIYAQVYRARGRTSKAGSGWRRFFWATLPVVSLSQLQQSARTAESGQASQALPHVSAGVSANQPNASGRAGEA